MPFLFSYGSLQEDSVQVATFGRRLDGERDALSGFRLSPVRIDDPAMAATLGKTHHANVTFTGDQNDRVAGMAFDVTDAELVNVDAYEKVFAYERVTTTLESGREAWVYVHADSLDKNGSHHDARAG